MTTLDHLKALHNCLAHRGLAGYLARTGQVFSSNQTIQPHLAIVALAVGESNLNIEVTVFVGLVSYALLCNMEIIMTF